MVKRELLPNDKNVEMYQPGFGSKLWSSLKTGWKVLEVFFVFVIQLWALVLFALAMYIIYKKYGRNVKNWLKNKPRD